MKTCSACFKQFETLTPFGNDKWQVCKTCLPKLKRVSENIHRAAIENSIEIDLSFGSSLAGDDDSKTVANDDYTGDGGDFSGGGASDDW